MVAEKPSIARSIALAIGNYKYERLDLEEGSIPVYKF
jgi:hypothetical protein